MTSTDLNTLVTFSYLAAAVIYLIGFVVSGSKSRFIQ